LTLTITSGTGGGHPHGVLGLRQTQSTGNIYNGTLANFMATKDSFANGIPLDAGGNAVWSTGESVTYKFEVSMQDDNLANAGNVADSGTGYSAGVRPSRTAHDPRSKSPHSTLSIQLSLLLLVVLAAGLVDPRLAGGVDQRRDPRLPPHGLQSNSAAQGRNATQTFTWEARNT
jgi:hypothetical protein